MTRKIGLALMLALAVGFSAHGQISDPGKQAPAKQPSKNPVQAATPASPPATLAAARLVLAKKASGTESYAAAIEAYAFVLPPRDAVSLVQEFAPKAPQARRRALYSLSASLALVLGDYPSAALAFGLAAEGDADILLKSCRCSLASGELSQAARTLALVPETQGGKSRAGERRLASAWISLLSGRTAEAFGAAREVSAAGKDAGMLREALCILWLIASSSEFEALGPQAQGWSAADILAILRDKCPGSMELALAEARVSPKPSSWLLNSVHPLKAGEGERSLAEVDAASGQDTQATGVSQLQVGWFSREENARNLVAFLKSKGFSTNVEVGSTPDKEKRWAVIVETAGDWTRAQARLKDLGYESYLVP